MLSADHLTLAIDIQSKSYQLLRWVADAVGKGFIPAARAHQYASAGEAAHDWIEEHYLNLPTLIRPELRFLREFANFFGTYVTTSFEIVEKPGTKRVSDCGCGCPMCSYLVAAPHLRTRQVSRRDKDRARRLMADRVLVLAREEGMPTTADVAENIVADDATRRQAAFSAYGFWLIRRLEGDTEGTSILALWREIAWTRAGSPIRNFKLEYKDFIEAEEVLLEALPS